MNDQITAVRQSDIDAAIDELNPMDEPLRSVWEAVSTEIAKGSNHISIAREALRAAMVGTSKRGRA